jgi:hypothetical protein
MPSAEFLAALNNIYYIAMPTFNESTIAGAPAEIQAVFRQMYSGGSTIDDITAGIATENPNSGVTPEIVFQVLTQFEQAGLIAHSDSVSGYSGMMVSTSGSPTPVASPPNPAAFSLPNTNALTVGDMFSPDRVSPILNSSQAIEEMGRKEDQDIINAQMQTNNPIFSVNVPLTVNSPELMASSPNIAVSDPNIGSAVPPVTSSSPEIKASTPQIGF